MGPIGFRETSAQNYQSTPRKIPEERRSLLHFGGSLNSRKLKCGVEGDEDKYDGVPVTRVITGAERHCSVSIQRIRQLYYADTQRERERERERARASESESQRERERVRVRGRRLNVRNTKAEGFDRGQ